MEEKRRNEVAYIIIKSTIRKKLEEIKKQLEEISEYTSDISTEDLNALYKAAIREIVKELY